MKLLHLIPTLDPRAGGPPLIVSHLAAAQAMLGHDVHVMTYKSREDGLQRIITDNRQRGFDRVFQHLLPYITMRERITGNQAAAMARELVPQMDALHIHGVWESMLYRSAVIARRHNKPYLILLNGMLLPWAMQRGQWKKRLALIAGAHTMLNTGILHCGSDDEAKAARALGYTNPSVIIPNGASPEEFANLPAPGTIGNLVPELGDAPYVLFLGRLHEQKGIDLLLAAFQLVIRQHPTAKLIIAGPDYGRSDEIKQRSAPMGNRLLMIGPIFGEKKLSVLRDATCFCLPSRHEGFSLAVLESLAIGTPVVISAECHFPAVAEKGAGVIPPLKPPDIAAALMHFLQNPTARQSASAAAKKMITERYTWPHIAQQTLAAYAVNIHGRESS